VEPSSPCQPAGLTALQLGTLHGHEKLGTSDGVRSSGPRNNQWSVWCLSCSSWLISKWCWDSFDCNRQLFVSNLAVGDALALGVADPPPSSTDGVDERFAHCVAALGETSRVLLAIVTN
jgi:hypothetical protein